MALQKVSLKTINRLALPGILAGIAEPLISLADTAIIGSMNEHATEAVGAAGMASSFFLLLVWGLAQVRTAVSALVSQYLGRDKLTDIVSLVPQAFAISVLLGLLTWGLTAAFAPQVFGVLYNTQASEPKIMEYALDYYYIRAAGLPFALLTAGIFGVFRGFQNTAWAMYISLGAGALNIVLDIILVHGLGETIPAMGVKGAAWASFIAQGFMVIAGLIIMLKKTPFNLKLILAPHPEMKRMLGMTGNMIIRTFTLNLAFFIAYRYANDYGKETLAAYTIGVNIWLFSSFFIDGFSNAGNALAGKLLGAENRVGLAHLGNRLLKINIGIAGLLCLCYAALYPLIGSVFSNDDAVIKVFNSFFWIVILSQPINAIAFTFDGIFKGLGETKYLRNTLIAATFIGFIPMLLIADKLQLEVFSIWCAFVSWMLIRSVTLYVRFRGKYR